MNLVRRAVCSMVALLVLPVAADAQGSQAPALTRPGGVIAYVSGQRLSAETTVGKEARGRVQALQQAKTAELKSLQVALETTRQQLANTPDGTARLPLQQQEQQQRADLDRATAQAQADIQALQRQIATDMQGKVRAQLTELLKGTDIQVVVQLETAIVWAAPGLDLTSAVIERLNASDAAAPSGTGAGK
jgi:Skp family chaperone for outer membrane proteins